jgi:hypothetical protein
MNEHASYDARRILDVFVPGQFAPAAMDDVVAQSTRPARSSISPSS